MKKLIALTLFVCNPLLCMDADTQPDIGATISVMKHAERAVNTFNPAILQDHTIVLLTHKKEYSTAISPIAFFRRKDGKYNPMHLPNDFSTKIICGDVADEIEVTADGNKHNFLYNLTHRLMGFERLGHHVLLFQNPTIGTAITTPQPLLNTFFSSPETTRVPVQKLYPYSREINALRPTKHTNIFRMPETSNTLLIAFKVELMNKSIILPTTLVAVTPEGCLTLPFPTEKIKSILALKEEDHTGKSLSLAILNTLVTTDDLSGQKVCIRTETLHQEFPYGLGQRLNDGTADALIEEHHATTLSLLTKISLETLQRYQESLQAKL